MVTEDGGKQIVAGNERVLRARLSDAKFFWDQDRKRMLESRVDDLKNIVFHAKLGTQYERVERIEALAGEIAEKIGADVERARRAARLCKADLTTGVVGEFPELQGVMGRYYALHDGEDADVADAIRDHYRPLGPNDAVPTNKVSIAVALADKLYNVVALTQAGERPTGSGDPFALRRAALGAIRIVIANSLRLGLFNLITKGAPNPSDAYLVDEPLQIDVLLFFLDRLRVSLREKGTRYDLIEAVFWLGNEDDLVRLVARVEALQAFLKTDDGANLLVAYRRAANILRDEEKRDKTTYDGEPDPELLTAPEEKALFVELATASELIRAEVERERFVEAMGVMARLRKPVDAFFDKVTVNDKNTELRQNRLKLLSRLRATLHLVADFSKIEG
jgi:glycyl-tRNA synthetase beta chain